MTIETTARPSSPASHPPGFRARRGLNWFTLGLMYASFYLCRYNFRWATPDIRDQFGFSYEQITLILGYWSWAYGIGQLINGLFTDRIGGKMAMFVGAVGMIGANLAFGAASTAGSFMTFSLIWMANGYMQAFGAPGMIKINAAWFSRAERGTFAGIFGFMIQLGQFAINKLAPALLSGFTLALWTVPKLHWKWLFWIPPMIAAVMVVLMVWLVKETPEEAGFAGVHEEEAEASGRAVRVSLKESFLTIVKHPLVWYYAMAYACTGAVRHGSDHLAVLYFADHLHLDRQSPALSRTLQLMPVVAVLGSFGAGLISDKIFRGHRSPVAMTFYFLETAVILLAVLLIEVLGKQGVFLSCLFLVLISLTANSTHSIVGAAAPMDIGGRKMAGFAAGVIDSFQYFGAAIALPLMGKLLDNYGWVTWFPAMAGFGFVGGCAMWLVIRKQRWLARHPGSHAGASLPGA
jgi:OPA family glycerol-3-phosphate transporter-like MFS transporter